MDLLLAAILLAAPPAGSDTVPDLPLLDSMDASASEQQVQRIRPGPWADHGPPANDAIAAVRRSAVTGSGDPWLAEDKLKHFFVSFAITAFAYSGARAAGIDDSGALGAAIGASAAAGIGKEIYDLRTKGRFSLRDMVWNAGGVAAAAVLLREAR